MGLAARLLVEGNVQQCTADSIAAAGAIVPESETGSAGMGISDLKPLLSG